MTDTVLSKIGKAIVVRFIVNLVAAHLSDHHVSDDRYPRYTAIAVAPAH